MSVRKIICIYLTPWVGISNNFFGKYMQHTMSIYNQTCLFCRPPVPVDAWIEPSTTHKNFFEKWDMGPFIVFCNWHLGYKIASVMHPAKYLAPYNSVVAKHASKDP